MRPYDNIEQAHAAALERAAIVRWLRESAEVVGFAGEEEPWEVCDILADAIERGEHER